MTTLSNDILEEVLTEEITEKPFLSIKCADSEKHIEKTYDDALNIMTEENKKNAVSCQDKT